MYKIILCLVFILLAQIEVKAQIVNIPDANFKAALLAHGSTIIGSGVSIIDTNNDGEIQVAEAQAYSGKIDVSNKSITDLTGVQAFTVLTVLNCRTNQLNSLDVSNNINLDSLNLQSNQISSLDVSFNLNLTYLNCNYNQITSLDLSQNSSLIHLECFYNQISSLNLTNNTALTYLNCRSNGLPSLNLTNNTALTYLNCNHNLWLTSLDLTNNIALNQLDCSYSNQLTSLSVTNCTALTSLKSSGTLLTSLDVTNCTALTFLDCVNNQLTSLDLTNNIALTRFECDYNQLTSLDLTNNTALTFLKCYNNPLGSLDLSQNTNLTNLYCSFNQLTSLDLTNNTALTFLHCSDNPLGSLDLSQNTNLTTLFCYFNQLTNLDLSNNTALTLLNCGSNPLGSLDLSQNTNLTDLYCSYNQLSNLDITNNTALTSFNCKNNLPLLEICVLNLIIAQLQPNWNKDLTASYIENCHSPLAVEGTIVLDDNNNCQVDTLEKGLNNILLMFNNGIDTNYAFTNSLGTYQAYLDTGIYTVTAIPSHPYFTPCPTSQSVTIDTNYQVQTIDFSLQTTTICPYLEVDIATPLLRRCFNSTYYVDYCNTGTTTANNAYIEVELDTSLYFNSSSIPLVSQTGNTYRFNVGNLPKDTCGRFSIEVTVSCYSQLGQIHCAEVHIYPDSLCLTSLPNIHIADTCLLDTVLFLVTNYADAATLPYLLLEDTVVVDTGSFTLNMGQSASLYYPINSNGTATYQLVLANGNPTYYTASALVGCNANSASTELLHLPHLPQDFADIDCTPNRGSYDPNDKTGYPLGYTNNHYIQPNSTIDYRIRFQNTGTDTAIFISILDTISPYLDLSTLNMGVASHAYTLQIMPSTLSGEQVLRFQFNPIYLPDSNVNEPASNGFIHYSIAQKPNLPNGTIINNSASIYFDYNAPVKTNTTLHTVCDNCLPQNIIITHLDQTFSSSHSVITVPNPFSDRTRIVLEGYTGLSSNLSLEVYDVMGRLQTKIEANNEAQFTVQRGEMPTGIYFFRIRENGQLLQSGRLMVGE